MYDTGTRKGRYLFVKTVINVIVTKRTAINFCLFGKFKKRRKTNNNAMYIIGVEEKFTATLCVKL